MTAMTTMKSLQVRILTMETDVANGCGQGGSVGYLLVLFGCLFHEDFFIYQMHKNK